MKKTGIMTDSHSGILENEASKLGIAVLPMPFYIDEKLYREGVDISREEFYEMLRKGADVATSQPSPESVMHMWSAMLQEYEERLKLFETKEAILSLMESNKHLTFQTQLQGIQLAQVEDKISFFSNA